MCGRFQLSVRGKVISERFNVEVHDELHRPSADMHAAVGKGYNCAPGQLLPLIINQLPNKLSFFKWGLVPSWSKDTAAAPKMINSRAETLHQKPSFRNAFMQRRCIVPANGFYEWKKGSTYEPWRFCMKDESLFAFAGIWEKWQQTDGQYLHTFSIITTEANELMQPIHHRMPVILKPEMEESWLSDADPFTLKEVFKPFPAKLMYAYPVSSAVNNVRNDDERLIMPVPQQPKLF